MFQSNGISTWFCGFWHSHSHLFQPVPRSVHGGLLSRVSSMFTRVSQSGEACSAQVLASDPGKYFRKGQFVALRVMPMSSESTSIIRLSLQCAMLRLSVRILGSVLKQVLQFGTGVDSQ